MHLLLGTQTFSPYQIGRATQGIANSLIDEVCNREQTPRNAQKFVKK
jgi:hypothetical protein